MPDSLVTVIQVLAGKQECLHRRYGSKRLENGLLHGRGLGKLKSLGEIHTLLVNIGLVFRDKGRISLHSLVGQPGVRTGNLDQSRSHLEIVDVKQRRESGLVTGLVGGGQIVHGLVSACGGKDRIVRGGVLGLLHQSADLGVLLGGSKSVHSGDQSVLGGLLISGGSVVKQSADLVNVLDANDVRERKLGERRSLGIL